MELPHVNFPKLGKNSENDWKIIFSSATTLVVLFVFLSIFVFIKIDKGEIFLVERLSEEEDTLDIAALKETVSYYENRALEFENIKNTTTPAVDPSL
ncbi:MAG: hypothetical protein HYT69_01070 [Candidatus Zambryskibacteria bacterium]|nr:hypothetical protein [Candidatus Zambryskibacteria bacterium]